MDSMQIQQTVDVAVHTLKVSAHSRTTAVAGAIAGVIRENGAGRVAGHRRGGGESGGQGVAIARSYLEPDGIEYHLYFGLYLRGDFGSRAYRRSS